MDSSIEVRLEGLEDALHPGPGLGLAASAPKLPSASKAWKEVQLELSRRAPFWPRGLTGPSEIVEHVRDIVASAKGTAPPEPIDPVREGVLVGMLASARIQWDRSPSVGPKVLRYHVARGGLPLALEAQVRGAGLRYRYEQISSRRDEVEAVSGAVLEPGTPALHGFDGPWTALRELRARLALASNEELAACDSVVDRLRAEPLEPSSRAALAYLCPHRPELALAALDAPRELGPLLLQSLTDPDRALDVALGWQWGTVGLLGAPTRRIGAPLARAMLARLAVATERVHVESLVKVLGRFGDADVADALVAGLASKRFAAEWVEPFLLAFPALSLPRLAASGQTEMHAKILAAHPELDPNAGPVATESSLPPSLRGTATRPMPSFWQPTTWTTLTTKDGAALSFATLNRFGELLMEAEGRPTPEVRAAMEALDEQKLADFLFDMVQAWSGDWRARSEKWALPALALLGDAHADRVGTLVRKWTGNAYQTAVAGLKVLVAMGGDRALLQLGHIAERHKTRGVKNAAASQLAAIARARGLTREELDDRLVPTLGLDAKGAMVLDYGPRRFEVRFDEHLQPSVRDEKGKLKSAPPKPGASDDVALASAALESFKLLKKDVRTLASTQIARLEAALVTGRRWKNADAARFVYRHPLLGHVGRRLLWSTEGARFRIDEEGATVDVTETPIAIAPDAPVWLAHPIELDDAERARWSELFADYEILSPIAQLGRPVFRFGDVAGEQVLEAVRRAVVPAGRVRSLLNHGWLRGGVEDAGQYYSLTRSLSGTQAELLMENGLNVNAWSGEADVQMKDVRFTKQGTAVSFSEVVRELSALVD